MAPNRDILFQSQAMNDLVVKARRFARSSASVLITGESGTGKELFARLIHNESQRSKQNYITVNCAAMPEMLVESEMFGHERGAFTGAFQQRVGHFQMAHCGTILLDEISEIPASIQAKLLRVIEEQEVLRIGSSQPEKIDVRIVATSNRDLKIETKTGTFRLDLFHRLNVLHLKIPPLRERISDIPMLANYYLQMFQYEATQPIHDFSRAAMQRLCDYHWPGNIRELRNIIQRACIECPSCQITIDYLPTLDSETDQDNSLPIAKADLPLADLERQAILSSLEKHGGNKTAAASELGVTPRTLSNKLKIYRAA